MKGSAWLILLALAEATHAQSYGLWIAGLNDDLWEVCHALNITGYGEIRQLNSLGDVRSIDVGRTYTVPYKSAIAPASWFKGDSQFLHMNKQERTTPLQTIGAATEATALPTQKVLAL
ncbi:hypothetical protein BHE90_017342 [Fusarium euwallaceae]|uniref:LysM domain-containing protein n=1 Tax=Fusarium euwallaceae TaxID=1147111 RepID=A0A430KXR2_9HYPO|nr:hypothetical protein BHE90_017342 [Fusarium euwallaceae]